MEPLITAVKQLQEVRYHQVSNKRDYIDAVENIAEELTWHLQRLGISWGDIVNEIETTPTPQLVTFEVVLTSAISKLRS